MLVQQEQRCKTAALDISDARTPVFPGFGRSGFHFYRTPVGPGFLLPNIERSGFSQLRDFPGISGINWYIHIF